MESCYKVFKRDVIRNIHIEEQRFGFEPEITAKIAKMGCAVYEVGIAYYGRTYEQGKKISTKDGFAALWYIVKYNLLTTLRASYAQIPQLEGMLTAEDS